MLLYDVVLLLFAIRCCGAGVPCTKWGEQNKYAAQCYAQCLYRLLLFAVNVELAVVEPCTLLVESKTSMLHIHYTHSLYNVLLLADKCGAGNGRAVCTAWIAKRAYCIVRVRVVYI